MTQYLHHINQVAAAYHLFTGWINGLDKTLNFCFNPGDLQPKMFRLFAECLKKQSMAITWPSSLFAYMTELSAKSRYVKTFFLNIAQQRPCSTVCPNTQSIQTLNRDGASTQPCRTPVATEKYSDNAPPIRTALAEPE